ncbi:MAG: linear amide C-N hydrolase [Bacteroidetes bacterium]|nr:linear amide C-N hydrolase [Bacteroidota bacterium]
MKNIILTFIFILGILFSINPIQTNACTRAVYLGPDSMVITGRTMDWKEDIQSNLYIFPRGIERVGAKTDNTIKWTSKYGSVIATAYDISTSDGMNEMGLVANILYLAEANYTRANDEKPVMGISIWAQYVLDNFATVDEAVKELSKETFRLDAPNLPNNVKSVLHLAISDSTGNSAILEYIDGNLVIHEGREFQVMTNSPIFDQQIALNKYWEEIGGLVMLPGTNRASDRYARASFYIKAVEQSSDPRIAAAGVFSVMRNVSVPIGITTPNQPNISSTRWRSVSNQKDKVYFFESTLSPSIFWVNFKDINFKKGASIKKLALTSGEIYSENAIKDFKNSKPFDYIFGI